MPNGLEFNFSNGEITGTPLSITDVNCVISASNQDGVFNFSINFEVIIAPPNLLTDDSIHMFIIGYSNKSIIIDNIGGTASIWELIDDLPDGLDFSITNGIISELHW